MVRSSDATRARLVDAAVTEFAARGLAGGRVDRIAAAAVANKRAIYDYFGNKEGLFDAAVARVTGDLIAAVPLDPGDLPAYAGDLFDHLLAHPEAVRMISWRRLERPRIGPRLSDAFVEPLLHDRGRPGAIGSGSPIGPVDLVILAIGLANAWELSAPDLLDAAGEDPTDPRRIAVHRAAVVTAAQRISRPG